MIKSIKKYLTIYYMFVRSCLMKEMERRGNFLLMSVTTTFLNLYFLFYYLVLADRMSNNFLGWSKNELLFFLGTEILCHSTFMATCFYNVFTLPDHVRTGSFDFLLIKPVNTRFLLSTRNFNFSTFSQILFGIALTTYSYIKLGFKFSLAKLLLFIILILNSVMIMYLIGFTLMCLAFYFTKISSYGSVLPYRGFFAIYWFARRPENIFSSHVIQLLTYVCPVLLIVNLPCKWMIRSTSPITIIWAFVFSILFFALSHMLWKKGLQKYESASS